MEKNELKIGATYSSGAKAGIQLQFDSNDYLGEVVFWCDNGNENDLKANNCGEWESYPLAKERAEKIVKSYNEYDTLVKEKELLIEALENINNMLLHEIKETKRYLGFDVGLLSHDSDPYETRSFTRGKQAAFCIAKDSIKKLLDNLKNK